MSPVVLSILITTGDINVHVILYYNDMMSPIVLSITWTVMSPVVISITLMVMSNHLNNEKRQKCSIVQLNCSHVKELQGCLCCRQPWSVDYARLRNIGICTQIPAGTG